MIRIGSAPLTVTAPAFDDDWRARAACTTKDTNLFFADGTTGPNQARVDAAKAVCQHCPVINECGQWAIDARIEYGVFGGIDEIERRRLLRNHGAIKQRGSGRPKAPCGTRAAYDRHRKKGEPIDPACAAARYTKPLKGADLPPEAAA